MNMNCTSKAYAKLNLSLDILGKMPDGYHEMKMVMQTVSLCDEISVSCKRGGGLSVSSDLGYIPSDERNIAYKVAYAFFEHTRISGYRTEISIKKNIPVCAGLGGGSADAACVLRMLNEMFDAGLDSKILERLGLTVGADVPFCIEGGTKLAEGKGEILTDLTPIMHSNIIICKPTFSCSTPELFSYVKCDQIRARPDTDGLIKALEQRDMMGVVRRMYNVFEDILPSRKRQEVDDIKSSMLDCGAMGAIMTGSGPAVFGVFESKIKAQDAYEYLMQQGRECYLAETMKKLC